MAERTVTVHLTDETALPPPSIDDLDLTSLPARLDDTTLAMVEQIGAKSPPYEPCDDRHFAQCLRVMLAVLPRQNADALGGELFVETYRRHLAHYPNEAISFLAERATATCRWFPTIAECLEIISTWRRNDPAGLRWLEARRLAEKERSARRAELTQIKNSLPNFSHEALQTLTPQLRKIGLGAGWLVENSDGTLDWARTDG